MTKQNRGKQKVDGIFMQKFKLGGITVPLLASSRKSMLAALPSLFYLGGAK